MKKTLLTLFIFSAITFSEANAQEETKATWPATSVLPEAHDWSLGFDVVPVIRTVGNLFHTPSGNDSIYSQEQFTIVALHVKNDNTAYRFRVRIGVNSNKADNFVKDDANPQTQLTDTWTDNSFNLTLGAGIQKNRGKGRLRLIYGGEASILFGTHGNTYDYGNPMTQIGATSTDFSQPLPTAGFVAVDSIARITTNDIGNTFGFGLNAFAGVEYFFAPKISLSAEYGWGLLYKSTGEGTTTVESWDTSGGSGGNVSSTSVKVPSSSKFSLDVANATSIILHFYF